MLESIVASVLASGLVVGVILFLFKQSITAALKLDVDQRLNIQKSELEKVRDKFQFQIQQAMLSIQIRTSKAHEIYPELYEKMRITDGAVGRLLGARMANTWQEYSPDDLREVMKEKEVVTGQIDKIMAIMATDRPKAIKEMESYFRMLEHQEARQKFQDTKNYLILKNLYITDEISEDCFKVGKYHWDAIVDANPDHVQFESFTKNINEADVLLTLVKNKMRKELTYQPLE